MGQTLTEKIDLLIDAKQALIDASEKLGVELCGVDKILHIYQTSIFKQFAEENNLTVSNVYPRDTTTIHRHVKYRGFDILTVEDLGGEEDA